MSLTQSLSLTRQNYFGPLDRVPNAVAAYGLRRLRFGYTGPAIRVRRSSDNTEADIGFDGAGDLNTAALLAHVGAGNGFVTAWYDQSGNGRNATQATAANQPSIVTAGVVNTANGRSALQFNGSSQSLSLATQITTTDVSINGIAVTGKTSRSTIFYARNNSVPDAINALEFNYNASSRAGFFSRNTGDDHTASVYTAGTVVCMTGVSQGVDTTFFSNGVSGTEVTNAKTQQTSKSYFVTIGAANSGTSADGAVVFHSGSISEIMLFTSALFATDRQTLERNQGNYYGIAVA